MTNLLKTEKILEIINNQKRKKYYVIYISWKSDVWYTKKKE